MPHDSNAALLSAALSAAEHGWHVFPLRPDDKRPVLHGETRCPGTGPCASGHVKWEQRATTDPDRIRRAWTAGPFNIGLACGPSGLVVVDLDQPKDKGKRDAPCGAATFKALCERAGQAVPTTCRVRTASGGAHLYFTAPDGVRLHNTAGTLGPLIDTRAWGGYVVAPGSTVHGGTYEVTEDAPVAPLPEWLCQALTPPQVPAQPVSLPVPDRRARYAEMALLRETAAVAGAVEGGREAELFRAARAMGRFVAWGDLPRHVVEEAFQQAAQSTGLPPSQCRSTLRSALDWSIAHCRPRDHEPGPGTHPLLKSPSPPRFGPGAAKRQGLERPVGGPKGVGRKAVPSSPDPHPGDGRTPIAWLHITAPGRGTTPTATSQCACGRNRSAVGHTRVLELAEEHAAHRAECPLRTTTEQRTAA